MIPPRAHNSIITEPKDTKADETPEKGFKRLIFQMTKEFKEDTNR